MPPRRTQRAKKTSLPQIDEHAELVSPLFQELRAEASGAEASGAGAEAGAGASSEASGEGQGQGRGIRGGASGASGTLEEEFYRVQRRKTLKLEKIGIMAAGLKSNVELTAFERLRKIVEHCDISSDLRNSMLKMLDELEVNLPTVFEWPQKPSHICEIVQTVYPDWDRMTLANLVGVLLGSNSSTSTPSKCSFSMFLYSSCVHVHSIVQMPSMWMF